MQLKVFIFLAFWFITSGCTTVVKTVAKEVVNQRMDEATKDFQLTTYVADNNSSAFLEDEVFKIKIVFFGINRLNGIYSGKIEAENISKQDAEFDPDLIELEGIDTSVKYQSAIKGQVKQSMNLAPGMKKEFFLSFYGEAMKPAALIIRLTYGKTSISFTGSTEKLIKY